MIILTNIKHIIVNCQGQNGNSPHGFSGSRHFLPGKCGAERRKRAKKGGAEARKGLRRGVKNGGAAGRYFGRRSPEAAAGTAVFPIRIPPVLAEKPVINVDKKCVQTDKKRKILIKIPLLSTGKYYAM